VEQRRDVSLAAPHHEEHVLTSNLVWASLLRRTRTILSAMGGSTSSSTDAGASQAHVVHSPRLDQIALATKPLRPPPSPPQNPPNSLSFPSLPCPGPSPSPGPVPIPVPAAVAAPGPCPAAAPGPVPTRVLTAAPAPAPAPAPALCRSARSFAACSTRERSTCAVLVISVVVVVVVVFIARHVVARWRAFVAQRTACPLLDLLEDCPDLFVQEVWPDIHLINGQPGGSLNTF